jgi:hypothetical protein
MSVSFLDAGKWIRVVEVEAGEGGCKKGLKMIISLNYKFRRLYGCFSTNSVSQFIRLDAS